MLKYRTLAELFSHLESLMLITPFREVSFTRKTPSHLRVRSSSPEQFAVFQKIPPNNRWIKSHKTVKHENQPIVFAKLANPLIFQTTHAFHWLEFTAPNPEHPTGLDAIIFQAPELKDKTYTLTISQNPKLILRFQAKSAQEITQS